MTLSPAPAAHVAWGTIAWPPVRLVGSVDHRSSHLQILRATVAGLVGGRGNFFIVTGQQLCPFYSYRCTGPVAKGLSAKRGSVQMFGICEQSTTDAVVAAVVAAAAAAVAAADTRMC
jgi:hypothetical protein